MAPAKVGAAPLIAGLVLAGDSVALVTEEGLAAWPLAGVVAGCAAAVLGASVLLKGEGNRPDPAESKWPTQVAVAFLAGFGLLAGAVLALM